MQLTLGQAAKLAGHGKTTLTRAIQAGKLSAVRRDDGTYQIDLAELSRVYKLRHATPETVLAKRPAVHRATGSAQPSQDTETAVRLAELETENRMLRELLAEIRQSREELRQDRDDWRSRAERLLTDERKAVSTPPAPAPAPPHQPEPPPAPAPHRPASKSKSTPAPEPPAHFVSRDDMDTAAGLAAIRARLERELARRDAEDDDANASRH